MRMHNPDGQLLEPGKAHTIPLYGTARFIGVVVSHYPNLVPAIEGGVILAYCNDSDTPLQPHDLVGDHDKITLCF